MPSSRKSAARFHDPIEHVKSSMEKAKDYADEVKDVGELLATHYGLKKAAEMGALEKAYYQLKLRGGAFGRLLRRTNLAAAQGVSVVVQLLTKADSIMSKHKQRIRIDGCADNVRINSIRAAVVGSHVWCFKISGVGLWTHQIWPGNCVTAGSKSVLINGKPAARVGDAVWCGAEVTDGSPDVFIGD